MEPEQGKFLLNFFVLTMEEEFKITKKVLQAVPEAKRDYRPDPKGRTAFELAWHIPSSEVWFLDGILNGQFGAAEEPPSNAETVADIVGWYEKNFSERLAKLKALSGEHLTRAIPFFGMEYPAVVYLSFLTHHSAHHRGQLSTYLRPMGSKIPSIYGGSADEPFEMAATS